MKKLLIMTTIFLGLSLNIVAQETELTNKELLEKIEVLEVEIEKVKIEASDNSPMAAGETLDWGSGLSFGAKLSSDSDAEFELMYNFPIKAFKNDSYISKDNSRTLGIGLFLGAKSNQEMYFDRDETSDSYSYTVGLKLNLSAPVMMNYISMSAYITPFAQFLIEDENDYASASAVDFGMDFGMDINFWISNNGAIFVGMMCDPSIASIYGDRDLQNPLAYKMTLGSKSFF